MRDQECLYTLAFVPHERLEQLLLDEFAPIARDIEHHPDLDSLFFVRYSEPRWQIRFRVLGRPDWVQGALRDRLKARLTDLRNVGGVEEFAFERYEREIDRYGGMEGMALAEKLFFLDSMAAADLCDAERHGLLHKPRREVAMLVVDRLLGLARFDPGQRLAFYRRGYSWALENGDWNDQDLQILEERFRKNLPGLERLFEHTRDDADLWGGDSAAAVVQRFFEGAQPVLDRILEGHAAGRIRQDIVYLFWSYAHMFTNRMGIESTAEAILRFFMHRYLESRPVAA